MRRPMLTLCLAALLPLAACDDSPDGSGSSEEPAPLTAADLNGRAFVSTSVTGYEMVGGTELRLAFDDDRVNASAGCKTKTTNGDFTVEGDVLTIPEMITRTIACKPDLIDQDVWFSDFLTAGPTLVLEDDTLTLSTDDATLEMLDETVVHPAPSLTGTAWTLEWIVDGDAVSSVRAGVEPPTLEISEQGEATVFTGCNRGGASVEVGDDSLTFGPLRLTKMACPGDAASVESAVVAVLDGEVASAIEGSQLTLTRGDQRGLVYRAG